VAPLIRLIDDPRHMVQRRRHLQAVRRTGPRHPRSAAAAPDGHGPRRDRGRAQQDRREISDYLDILRSRARIQEIIRNEMLEIKEEFATPRRTEITEGGADFDEEDLIQREDMVVTVSHGGYIKRVPLATYRAQRRGGKGRSGMATKDEDFVTRLFVANTHTPVLFFSSRGIATR
jgi:DNA gyrase subunit A